MKVYLLVFGLASSLVAGDPSFGYTNPWGPAGYYGAMPRRPIVATQPEEVRILFG